MKVTTNNRVTAIIEYEQGDLNENDTLELFAHLIKTGLAWTLQGHYGRTATNLIEQGYISIGGTILKI